MALLDNLLGGNGGGLLGGGDNAQQSSNSSDFSTVLGTSPALGLVAHDVLHFNNQDGGNGDNGGDSTSLTGIGDLGLGISAPTFLGITSSQDNSSTSVHEDNGGGLLGGLL